MHTLPESADPSSANLFVHHGLMSEVAAHATVLLRNVEAQQPCLADEPPSVAVDVVLRSPPRVMRKHLGFDESRDGIAECGQVVVHPRGGVLQWHRCVSFRVRGKLTIEVSGAVQQAQRVRHRRRRRLARWRGVAEDRAAEESVAENRAAEEGVA